MRHKLTGTITSPDVEQVFSTTPEISHLWNHHRRRRFALLVPANKPGPDLCKMVASATVLGYPSPILINWGQDFSNSVSRSWGAYLAKITGTLDYLDHVTQPNTHRGERLDDDDLVLMVDAYDIWFQLPPDTLLQRYHQTNHDANSRLAAQWKNSNRMPMKQTIIAAAQKRCFPTMESGSNLYCDDLPQSNLRSDLYGSPTDTDSEKKYYHNVRPRFLNSGTFMGPVGDMRRYLRRVKQRMERVIAEHLDFEGDQGIFGEIFGEQELWRKWRRDQERLSSLNDTFKPSDIRSPALWQRDFEFHVGLDYSQQMFLPTVYAEDDGLFLSLENRSFIQQQSSKLGIDPVRLDGIPNDISQTLNDVADVLPNGVATDTDGIGWERMSLYADFYTASIPALLHHNAWKDNAKARRTRWWDQTWYFPHLRHMLERRLKSHKRGAIGRVSRQNTEVAYYPPGSDLKSNLPRVYSRDRLKDGFQVVTLDEACRYPDESSNKAWYDEVLRDRRGPIEL
ncbi:hypothetical protein QQS21_009962 [Conoideocrella luteorostrata]|uniref:Uncharacterized protein n=1 Tax=Conoideocrella luteorostrata TaxID=1105319 RepID=A0AAJ0CFY3_9HYPO|nr:hypothetical protein QQS21_009962 [Conoideocrella luteorostrata]